MMRKKTQVGVAFCAAAILALSAACSGSDSGTNSDKSLVISMTASFPDLDPHHSTSTVNYGINFDNVYEGLVRLDGQSAEILPGLATKWEQVDETTHRLTLREGVKFHNGEAFDAEAAAYSINRLLNDKGSAELQTYFSDFDGAKAVDKNTIEVKTTQLVPDFLLNLTYLMMVPPKATKAAGLSDKPIGTGPYQFVSRTSDSAEYKPFKSYWGEAAAEGSIKVVSRPELASSVAGIKTGEIDIAADLPAELIDEVPAVISAPLLETILLRLNGQSGITKDPKVREALDLAVDSKALREQFLGADYSSDAMCQLAPKGVRGHNPELDSDRYDPNKARSLLAEAGVEGKEVNLVGVRGRYTKGEEIVEAIKSELAKVGLKPQVKVLDLQGWLDQIYLGSDKAPDMAFIGINSDQWTLFQPYSSIVANTSELSTFPNREYPKVDELMSKAAKTVDESIREDLLKQASAEICASDSFVWLYNYDQIWATQKGISWDKRRDGRIVWSTIKTS